MPRLTFSPFVATATFVLGIVSVVPLWFFDSSPIGKTLESVTVQDVICFPSIPENSENSLAEISTEEAEACDDNGFYGYFEIAGKVRREFKNIELIELYEKPNVEQSSPNFGSVIFKNETTFDVVELIVKGKKISFKTKALRDVSYEFRGTLNYRYDEVSNEDTALKGVLKKIKDGKTVAESKVGFYYQECGC